MARGDSRKKNIKPQFETAKKKRGNLSPKTIGTKAKKKDPGVPDLRRLGVKLMKKKVTFKFMSRKEKKKGKTIRCHWRAWPVKRHQSHSHLMIL
jgi:hypothetical protein